MKTLLAFTVFSVALASAYGLKCYVCEDFDSSVVENSECGDTFVKDDHSKILQTCNASAGEVWCRKQKTGVNKLATQIQRSCAAQCEDDTGAYIDRVDCCQDSDGCNTGNYVKPAVTVLLSSTLYTIVKILA